MVRKSLKDPHTIMNEKYEKLPAMKTGSKWWKFSFWRKLVSNTLII
jgi:hypothetical protein